MPLYRFSRADAADRVAELEAKGEVVTAVANDGEFVDVATTTPSKRSAGGRETR